MNRLGKGRLAIIAAAVGAVAISIAGCGGARTAAAEHGPTHARPIAKTTADGCPRAEPLSPGVSMAVDYIDFLRFYGRDYWHAGSPRTTDRHSLGPVVGRVDCMLSALVDGRHRIVGGFGDGDAAFLPIGTKLHTVQGFSPHCRLAVRVHGEVSVYLAVHRVHATMRPLACALDR